MDIIAIAPKIKVILRRLTQLITRRPRIENKRRIRSKISVAIYLVTSQIRLFMKTWLHGFFYKYII